MSVIPARTASSTTSWIAGVSITGSISLGVAFVAGRNRVPSPATGITACWTFTRATVLASSERCQPIRDPRVHSLSDADVRVHVPRLRPYLRHRPVDVGRRADDVPGVRGQPAQGVRAAGDLVQGIGV